MAENEIFVKNTEHLENILKDRKENAANRKINNSCVTEDVPMFDHVKCANQTIKVIGILPIDYMIKQIMIRRLMNPLSVNQCEVTHLSLALELGLREEEVKEMEEFGLVVLEDFLNKHTAIDGVKQFNNNRIIENAVKQMKTQIG